MNLYKKTNLEYEKIEPSNKERLISLAQKLIKQNNHVKNSPEHLYSIVFDFYIMQMLRFLNNEKRSDVFSFDTFFKGFSDFELTAFKKFVSTINDVDSLDLLIQNLEENENISENPSNDEMLLNLSAFRKVLEREMKNLDSLEKLEQPNLVPLEENSRPNLDSLEVYFPTSLNFGQILENKLVNYPNTFLDFNKSCEKIKKLINDLESEDSANVFNYLDKIFFKKSCDLLKCNFSKARLKEFLLNYLNLILKMFEVSRIIYSIFNNLNLSFFRNILLNDERFLLNLFEEHKTYVKMDRYYPLYANDDEETLLAKKRELSPRKYRCNNEYTRRKNVICFLQILNTDYISSLNEIRDKIIACENGNICLDNNSNNLLMLLLQKRISVIRDSMFFEYFKNEKKELLEALLTDSFIKFVVEAQNPNKEKEILDLEFNKNYVSLFFDLVCDTLMINGYIESKSDLVWINCSSSPLDFIRSTDSMFVIKKGKYKDFIIKYDITKNHSKTTNLWDSVILFIQDTKEENILRGFEKFKRKVENYMKKASSFPDNRKSFAYLEGVSDMFI